MKASEILGVETVGFVEPAFAALTDCTFNMVLVEVVGDEGRLLVDENEEPLALAFRGPDGWTAGSFLCRNPSLALIERFEYMNGEIFQEDRAVWAAAVREYFSEALRAAVPPSVEDLNPVRRGILNNLISRYWGDAKGETCIDCCCGSGVGSLVLRELGYSPLSYDNDETLLEPGTGRRAAPPGGDDVAGRDHRHAVPRSGPQGDRDHDGRDQQTLPRRCGGRSSASSSS